MIGEDWSLDVREFAFNMVGKGIGVGGRRKGRQQLSVDDDPLVVTGQTETRRLQTPQLCPCRGDGVLHLGALANGVCLSTSTVSLWRSTQTIAAEQVIAASITVPRDLRASGRKDASIWIPRETRRVSANSANCGLCAMCRTVRCYFWLSQGLRRSAK